MGRKIVIIVNDDGTKRTKSYPRYLLEQHIGRELLDTETVDHINDDFSDDRIENLQILSRAENAAKGMRLRPAEKYKFTCPVCGKEAEKEFRNVRGNWKKGRGGPYCSRRCAGKVNARVAKR